MVKSGNRADGISDPELGTRVGGGALRASLWWGMWILAGGYVLALGLHAAGIGPSWDGWFGTFVDGWLGLLTVWAPAAVCWLAPLGHDAVAPMSCSRLPPSRPSPSGTRSIS